MRRCQFLLSRNWFWAPPDGAGNNTSAPVVTLVQAPDLRLTKTSAATTLSVGAVASFTLTPSNAGNLATSGTVTVVDTLPVGLIYVAMGSGGTGWTCAASGQTVTCTSSTAIGAASNGKVITINAQVGSNAVPSVTNTAVINGGNEPAVNSGNNSAAVTVGSAAVNTFLTDGMQAGQPGSSVLYTHVFNTGLSGTVVFSSVHTPSPNIPGWTVQIYRDNNCNGVLDGVDGATEITGSGFAVSPGQQLCIVVKSNIPASAPFNSQDVISVTASFTPPSGPIVSYTRTDITTVGSAPGSGLVLQKSVRNVTQGGGVGTSNSARPGDTIEYVITYPNSSNSPLGTISIADVIPAFTTFVSASCGAPLPLSISGCSVTTQPSVGGTGALQWTLTGTLQASRVGTVVFRVLVQ
jgi:uncharacterized repeat protein (TIGR01451 family)